MNTKLQYISLVLLGGLVIYVGSLLQHIPPPRHGEYYYSGILKNNYTVLIAILYGVLGLASGYYFRLNPWLTGLCLILIFPIVSLYEGTIYRGSHNLIPFEFGMHFFMALPAIAGAYIGRLVPQKAKGNTN